VSKPQPERVRALAEEALDRADAARRELDELLAAVERLRAELAGPAVPREEEPRPAASLDAARLAAIEMAVAGRTREQVERHLRDAYRGPDTAELLDDVFGAEPQRRGASSI
jgi:hypothetical protein